MTANGNGSVKKRIKWMTARGSGNGTAKTRTKAAIGVSVEKRTENEVNAIAARRNLTRTSETARSALRISSLNLRSSKRRTKRTNAKRKRRSPVHQMRVNGGQQVKTRKLPDQVVPEVAIAMTKIQSEADATA